MSKFARRFEARSWDALPVVRTLLDYCKLPGEASGPDCLRLAVRNGYANFYRKGQSVAKLHATASQVKFEIHKAYGLLCWRGRGQGTAPLPLAGTTRCPSTSLSIAGPSRSTEVASNSKRQMARG